MKRAKTPSHILTLPLNCEPWQRDYLDKLFRVSGNIYNNLVADRFGALKQLERTKAWKSIQARLSALYAQRKKELTGKEDYDKLVYEKYKPLFVPLFKERDELLLAHGFTEHSFQARVQKWRGHHRKLVNTHVAQKIASTVWQKFRAYLYGNGDEIHFMPWADFRSIEGKSNESGIVFRDEAVVIARRKFPVKTAKAPREGSQPSPPYMYEQEALAHRVKYCRITRRWYPSGWKYFVQLVLEGEPPVKANPKTGEVLHPMGKGRVGYDIGTQTLAFSSGSHVGLVELVPEAQDIQNELRRINRAMDRSRRVMHPKMFNPDGTVIDTPSLPPECLTKRGKRNWQNSKRYERLASQRRYLYSKQAQLRIQQHQELANQLLGLGDDHYIEEMAFRALAKKAKPQEPEPGEKPKRRKRFGKSIANKAPATFVNILEKKVLQNGGSFQRINAWKAKASQYNHLNHQYNKKKLSQRWNIMPDGRNIQRDLYSAFLIQHTNSTLDGFIQELCDKDYPAFVVLHDTVISVLRGTKLPSSAGI